MFKQFIGNPAIPYNNLLPLYPTIFVVMFLEALAVLISYWGINYYSKGKITKKQAITIALTVEILSFLPTLLFWYMTVWII